MPSDPTKQAYRHALVLLAASSAEVVGYLVPVDFSPMSRRSYESGSGKSKTGLLRRNSPGSGSPSLLSPPDSNMHLTESLMAAFEATGDSTYLHMAEPIAKLIIGGHAAANDWRVLEHFTNKWVVDRTAGSPVLRP